MRNASLEYHTWAFSCTLTVWWCCISSGFCIKNVSQSIYIQALKLLYFILGKPEKYFPYQDCKHMGQRLIIARKDTTLHSKKGLRLDTMFVSKKQWQKKVIVCCAKLRQSMENACVYISCSLSANKRYIIGCTDRDY